MIKIDDDQTTIHITRGDATETAYNRIAFYFPIWDFENEEETRYEFQLIDYIAFVVYEKKGYTKKELFAKSWQIRDLGYTEPTTTPELILDTEDTRLFPLANKKQTFFYEIILNGTTTIIGPDEDGDKKIIVYPGGTDEGGATS